MAELVSKLKVGTESIDLYSSPTDVSDEGGIGSWLKVGGVRAYTHTHTGSERLKIRKNGGDYSPYNKNIIFPEMFFKKVFNTEKEAAEGIWHDVPIGRNVVISFPKNSSPASDKWTYFIKFTSSPIFFIIKRNLGTQNLDTIMKNKKREEKWLPNNNGMYLETYYAWSSLSDNKKENIIF